LPEELKSAIFSEKTAMSIWDICAKNGIKEDKIPDVAQMVGQVFLGLIPPNELKKEIKKGLGLSQEKAKKISLEIERFVLFSVKNSLAELYDMDFNPEKPKKEDLPQKDRYREPVE